MKNLQRGSAGVIIAVIIALFIGAGATYFFVNKKLWSPAPIANHTNTPLASSDTITAPIPTVTPISSGWKIYRNNEYGFQVQYPSFGKVITGTHYGGGIENSGEIQFAIQYKETTDVQGPGDGLMVFSVQPASSAPYKTLDNEYISLQNSLGTKGYTIKKISFGQDKGVLYYRYQAATKTTGESCYAVLNLFHNNFFFDQTGGFILNVAESLDPQCRAFYQSQFPGNAGNVAASFVFISKSDINNEWKTYINSQAGYRISYPPSYHVAFENNLLNFDENAFEKGNPKGVKIQIQKTNSLPVSADLIAKIPRYSDKVASGPGGQFDMYNISASDGKTYYRIFVWGIENDNQNVSKILNSFMFVPMRAVQASLLPDSNLPMISSMTPQLGPVGTEVVIQGKNFAGFEGELRLIFERSDGAKTTFSDQAVFGGSAGTQIKIKVQPPCEKGQTIYEEYSGKPSLCDYVEFTPGVYKVYAMSWGKQSNVVTFKITQ